VEKAEYIWMNGELVAWDDANVHVLSHGLHYGTGVFEGIRAYETATGPAVFRHREHYQRLHRSAELYAMKIPHSVDELMAATRELIARNGLDTCYIRPIAFRGYGEMGLYAQSAPIEVVIATWPWGAYLGEEGKRKGIRAKVSSWRTLSPESTIPQAKAAGQYLNSILAKNESVASGYDEAIQLDQAGHVSEGSGENIFVVRDGRLLTPPFTSAILEGITRHCVIEIARDLGFTVTDREITRAELYLADEAFFTGTAAELVPVREIDDHPIDAPGEITEVIQAKFEDALHGRAEEYREWLDPVGEASKVSP
jgi:branched-chain amino acid aminotransferase